MALADASHFDRLVEFLKQKRDNVTFHDIIALAEVSAQSLQSFFQAMDAKVYGELREIAGYIESMRHEIGALQVNDLKNSRIPAAGEELGAIVQATEAATNTIMECAEDADGGRRERPGRLQGAGRREDDGHLRGLLVPGHHRPAHRQGGRDARAHRAARRAFRRCDAGEGYRRASSPSTSARAPSARRNSCSTARSLPAMASTSPTSTRLFA